MVLSAINTPTIMKPFFSLISQVLAAMPLNVYPGSKYEEIPHITCPLFHFIGPGDAILVDKRRISIYLMEDFFPRPV
jgi:hypothetical protein